MNSIILNKFLTLIGSLITVIVLACAFLGLLRVHEYEEAQHLEKIAKYSVPVKSEKRYGE